MRSDALTDRSAAFAAEAVWGDEEPRDFEPVPVRRYFPNRALYRTRGPRENIKGGREHSTSAPDA
jgi:hypothetical protein